MSTTPHFKIGAADTASRSRSLQLSNHLQDQIATGQFRRGDSLPSERELMSRFDVSRATVREALRMLGALGLIEVKRGRNGGSFVRGPSGDTLRKSLDLFIAGHEIRYRDLVAVREAIEPAAAAQAAARRTAEDLDRLRSLSELCETTFNDIDKFSQANLDWHMAVIHASQNPLFGAFMTAVSSALFSATRREEFDVSTRKVVVGTHWRIFDAIRIGDSEAAMRRMGRHVNAYGHRLAPA